MTLQDKICDAGVTTLAELICEPCEGGGGSSYPIAVSIETKKVPIPISEIESVIINTSVENVSVSMQNPAIQVDSIPTLKFNIKECND